MLTHLLDTNIVSALYRAKPEDSLPGRIEQLEGALAIGAPVWHELRFGCDVLPHGRRKDALQAFLEQVVLPSFVVLPYDQPAADWHATERARLQRLGKAAPFVDGQIASIARVHDLVLVTDNTEDYAAFEKLRLENWLRS